jgi:hypothetical protein
MPVVVQAVGAIGQDHSATVILTALPGQSIYLFAFYNGTAVSGAPNTIIDSAGTVLTLLESSDLIGVPSSAIYTADNVVGGTHSITFTDSHNAGTTALIGLVVGQVKTSGGSLDGHTLVGTAAGNSASWVPNTLGLALTDLLIMFAYFGSGSGANTVTVTNFNSYVRVVSPVSDADGSFLSVAVAWVSMNSGASSVIASPTASVVGYGYIAPGKGTSGPPIGPAFGGVAGLGLNGVPDADEYEYEDVIPPRDKELARMGYTNGLEDVYTLLEKVKT